MHKIHQTHHHNDGQQRHGCGGGCHCHQRPESHQQSEGCCSSKQGAGQEGCCHSHKQEPLNLNKAELMMLLDLAQYIYLPISRFIISSSTEEASFVALAPASVNSRDDSLETVKERAGILISLEKKGLISLDYDIPIEGYDYDLHISSAAYLYFEETVREGKEKPNFICDTANIEKGSAAITELGIRAADSIKVF
jgi:hypothetical protein